MNNIEKLLINLESTKANIRYEACEELRVANAISKQAFDALEKATNDPDPEVADAAQRALLIHKPPTPASQEIQELDISIGSTEGVDEQKAPTIWHVLLVGTLLGVLNPLVILVVIIQIYSGEIDLWVLKDIIPFPTVASILGAAVGKATQIKKWKGMWVGAVLGSIIGSGLLFIYFLNALMYGQ